MSRFVFFILLLGGFILLPIFGLRAETPDPVPIPSPPVDFGQLPWGDGESLTYLVSYSGLNAAEGTFVARQKGDHWEFSYCRWLARAACQ